MLKERISTDDVLLQIANIFSSRSTCSRQSVGCVIAINGRIISTGYNGAPSGIPHCVHTDDSPCLDSVHAEANAIAFAAKSGIKTKGATIYTTHSPCKACAQLIINAGIKVVLYLNKHRDTTGIDLLVQAKIEVIRFGMSLE